MKTRKLLRYSAYLLLPAFLFQNVSAQEESDDEKEIFELSPFTVSTDQDIGYYASSSMAGSRINTSLRDVAASIQVVTEEFMEDIGATGLDTLLQYTTATETAGIQGNFVGFSTPDGAQTSSAAPRANIGNSQRIRGLGNPDKTRNFFKTLIPLDSYNTGRVDINRGANSFLFGLGSPAGLVNANLHKAVFKDSGEFVVRAGEGGEDYSMRTSFDYNKVVIDDVLAVRFSALYNDTNFRQRPTFYKDQRMYGTVTYKPLENTTIRAHFETVNIDSNPTDVLLPQENLSMFLDAPYGLARLSIDSVENARTSWNPRGVYNNIPFAGSQALRLQWPPHGYWTHWDGTGNTGLPQYTSVHGVRGAAMSTPPAYYNPYGTTRKPSTNMVYHGNYSEFFPVGYIQRGFVNLDTFDFSRYNLAGNNDYVKRDADNYNISLEQILWNGKAGFEIVYDRQEYDSSNWIVFHAGAEQIFFDINETLQIPDPNGDGMTPMPNPNYGRPAIMTQTWRPITSNEQDSYRFSGFVKHDFRDHMEGFLGKLFGRHQLTTLIDRVETNDKTVQYKLASFTPPGTPDDLSKNTGASGQATSFDRQMFKLTYIGPPQLDAFTDPNFTLADFQLNQITNNIRIPDGWSDTSPFWNVNTNSWDETTVTARWVPSDSQTLSEETVTSYAFNTSSYLLNDLVVVNLGWRRDEVDQRLSLDAPLGPDGDVRLVDSKNWNLSGVPTTTIKNDTFGWGVVANWPRNLIRTPDWFDISFHYNESENFVPAAGLEDYLGNILPSPTGTSKDYGFTLYLMDSKLVARVNWFEGALANSGSYWREVNGIVNDAIRALGSANQDIIRNDKDGDRILDEDVTDPDRSTENLVRAYQAREFLQAAIDPRALEVQDFDQQPDGSFSANWAGVNTTDLHDNDTEGLEIEIIANPTRNWRVSINVSRYETVLANIAPRLTDFINTVTIPYINEFGDLGYNQPTSSDSESAADVMNEKLYNFYATKAAEGTPSNEQREWNFNVVTNYRFSDGPLKGFSVGGAYRWQDRYAYGYEQTVLNGQTIPDINKPYWSDAQYNIDLWFGYWTKIMNKSVDMGIQLNIRNVNNWNSDNVSVVRVQPDGEAARARFDPPREIFITTTFRW